MTDTTMTTSVEDIASTATALFALVGPDQAALDLRLSPDDMTAIVSGTLDNLEDPTVLPRLLTWTVEHIDEFYRLRGRSLPPFDHTRTFWSNFASGPRTLPVPERSHLETAGTCLLFGRRVTFPFGVPACALTVNSDWVKAFAEAGYDVITYKTVRDRPWDAHAFPQWAIVPGTDDLTPDTFDSPVVATYDPSSLTDDRVSLANSFGVPSLTPAEWIPDVRRAAGHLNEGQVLIVSVMGTPEVTNNDNELADHFANAAAHAAEAGAHAIEANLSCPNTGGVPIYLSVETSKTVLAAIRDRVGPNLPILAKIGFLSDGELQQLFDGVHHLVDGMTAINSVSVPVVSLSGEQYFDGEHRVRAGISGTAIHGLALRVVSELNRLRAARGRTEDFTIIACGGVTNLTTYQAFRDAGADVVQSCSGAWNDFSLAARLQHDLRPELFEPTEGMTSLDVSAATAEHMVGADGTGVPVDLQLSLLAVLPPEEPLSVYQAAVEALLPPSKLSAAVASATKNGWVNQKGDDLVLTPDGARLLRQSRRLLPVGPATPAATAPTSGKDLDARFNAVLERLSAGSGAATK